MYIYFDKNGDLKEIITEKKFRNGDSARDKLYIYFDSEEEYTNGFIKYRKADGTFTSETAIDLTKVNIEIPTSPLRNLKYFNYAHTFYNSSTSKYQLGYQVYKITIPDEVLASATESENLCWARIRFVNESEEITALDDIPFAVSGTIGILTDESIDDSQYNYLLKKITDGTGSQVVGNPSGEVNEILYTISIDGELYGLPANKNYLSNVEVEDDKITITQVNSGVSTEKSFNIVNKNYVKNVKVSDDNLLITQYASGEEETKTFDTSKYVVIASPILIDKEYPSYPEDTSIKYALHYYNGILSWLESSAKLNQYVKSVEVDSYKIVFTIQDDTQQEFNIEELAERVSTTEKVIPTDATEDNKLVSTETMNDQIESFSAWYLTKTADGNQFATKEELDNATTFYAGGEARQPSKNDYTIVQYDITKGDVYSGYTEFTTTSDYIYYYVMYESKKYLVDEDNKDSLGIVPGTTIAYTEIPTTRYGYFEQWEFQYVINSVASIEKAWRYTDKITQNVGGISEGDNLTGYTSIEILRKMLCKRVPLSYTSLVLDKDKSGTSIEIGLAYTISGATANFTLASDDAPITSFTISSSGETLYESETATSGEEVEFTYSVEKDTAQSISITSELSDGTTTATKSITLSWYKPDLIIGATATPETLDNYIYRGSTIKGVHSIEETTEERYIYFLCESEPTVKDNDTGFGIPVEIVENEKEFTINNTTAKWNVWKTARTITSAVDIIIS